MQDVDMENRRPGGPTVLRPGQTAPASRPMAGGPSTPIPAAKPVLEQLHRFAAHMQGRSPATVRRPGQSEFANGLVTREILSSTAGELGLQVQYEVRDLQSLKDADFPCFVPLKDGTAYLATGLQNKSVLLVENENFIVAVPFRHFIDHYAGLVVLLQPLVVEQAASEPQKAADPLPASQQQQSDGKYSLAGKILNSILDHNKARLTQLALAATLSNVLLVVLPLFIMSVYDRIIPHLAMETLWALALGVVVALLVDLGLRISRSSLLEAIATSVSNKYQGQFYNRLMRLQMASMPRMAGRLSGAIQEFDNLCRIVPQAIIAILIDLPFFILLLGLLYYMGGAVVVAPLLGIIVIAVANMVTYSKSREVNAASTDLANKRSNQLIETLGAIETIKSTMSENQLLARWEQRTDSGAWLSYLARHQTNFASHLTIITVQMTIVLTLIIGVYELRAGGITMGALAASSLLVGRAMAPMGNLIALFVRGFHIVRSSSAVEQILEAPQETAGDRQTSSFRQFGGQIACNNVTFSYEADQPDILKNISFTIQPGERVGLIGRIGCGKSSLLKLLPRLQEASSGSLLLDGHDIRQYDPAFLRANMALMPQETLLVEGSLRENICFGLDEVDEQEFQRVVEISGVQGFASVHPQGYGMQVGPRGGKLSGGEQATVVLARTLLRQPKMLLLDEPTAAMDNDLERRIVNSLGNWIGDRSLIIATHRAPLLALVDRIIWLHKGQMIADGPRDEILAKLKG
jgi:ATP-binding cassette, subfamily C, bacterial LapB